MSTKKSSSELAANGLTLAQIGARVCYAINDVGGSDQLAKMIIHNPAMARSVGEAFLHPVWEVSSNEQGVKEFVRKETDLFSMLQSEVKEAYATIKPSTDATYRLRGEINYLGKPFPVCVDLPLEVAILLRLQIKPGELGFHWAAVQSSLTLFGEVHFPVLFETGALVFWKRETFMGQRETLPDNGVFIHLGAL